MSQMPQLARPVCRVRIARPNDAAMLADLAARLFEQTFGAANSADDMRMYLATAFSRSAQVEELSDPTRVVWIAEDDDGTPIGYAMVRRGGEGPGVGGARPAEVQRLYTDRAWHGRGVGATLMLACVDQARAWASDVIWLAVWEKNQRAIAFYEKTGFKTVGRQTFVLGRDVQYDLVMARGL